MLIERGKARGDIRAARKGHEKCLFIIRKALNWTALRDSRWECLSGKNDLPAWKWHWQRLFDVGNASGTSFLHGKGGAPFYPFTQTSKLMRSTGSHEANDFLWEP